MSQGSPALLGDLNCYLGDKLMYLEQGEDSEGGVLPRTQGQPVTTLPKAIGQPCSWQSLLLFSLRTFTQSTLRRLKLYLLVYLMATPRLRRMATPPMETGNSMHGHLNLQQCQFNQLSFD